MATARKASVGREAHVEAAELFRLLGDPTRLAILHALLEAGELCVCDLARVAGVAVVARPPARAEQHLRSFESPSEGACCVRLRTIVVSIVSGVVLLAACGSDHGDHAAASVEVSLMLSSTLPM
jgi:DNA-binding transcriptional ArsR family regulator